MSVLVYEPPVRVDLDGLEDELARAFAILRDAIGRDDTVIVVVDEDDVHGTDEMARSALAHGLIGLVRALAIEGRNAGWRINALAAPRGMRADERQLWISRLAEPGTASGALLQLGPGHLGKVPA